MRIVILVLSGLFLAACGEEERVVRQIGAITHTEYWTTEPLRWEGSSRHYEYSELCSPMLPKCLKGKYLSMSRFISPKNGKLAVTFLEGTWHDPPGIRKARSYFLDVDTGAEIKCPNCSIEKLGYGNGVWIREGEVFLPIEEVDSLSNKEMPKRTFIIEFSNQAANQRIIISHLFNSDEGYFISYPPSLKTGATLKCNPKCTIYWLNEDLTGYKSKPTGCASEKLFIVWNGDEPEAVFSNWAQGKDICLDKNGKPMFRQLSYDEELALNRAQP